MISSNNFRQYQDEFLVVDAAQPFYNTVNAVTTHLNTAVDFTNVSTTKLNKNQVGVFQAYPLGTSPKLHESVTAANNSYSKAPIISLVQGTGYNPTKKKLKYPLVDLPYDSSTINGKSNVHVTYSPYQAPTYSAWILGGNTVGNITGITPTTEYGVTINMLGKQTIESYGEGGLTETYTVVTPSVLPANPVNWVLQKIAWSYNSNSSLLNYPSVYSSTRLPLVVLALDYTNDTGLNISTITPTTFVPIMQTTLGLRGTYFSQEQIDSIKATLVKLSLPATTSIVTINKTTYNTGNVDGLMFLAIDRETAHEDFVPQVQTNIYNVGMTEGFDVDTVLCKQGSLASEGLSSRALYFQFRRQAQQKYYNFHENERNPITYPNPIDVNKKYSVFCIHHAIENNADLHSYEVMPFKTIVVVESTNTAFITDFTNFLNAWLVTANKPAVTNI